MTNIQDKVVIVTGAGSGAGRAIARSFVSSGAKVAFLGRRLNTLEDATRDLATDQVMICTCDVADRNLVNSTVEQIVSNFGPVDILVNNAGVCRQRFWTKETLKRERISSILSGL